MNLLNPLRLIYIPICIVLWSGANGQRLDFLERCPVRHCPVDCQKTSGSPLTRTSSACPYCECPAGRRCPQVVCPRNQINSRCRTEHKMDGCLTCICDERVYSHFDADNNVERFMLAVPDRPGFRRRCQSGDMRAIKKCTRGIIDLHEALRLQRPDLGSPIYAWYKLRRRELREFCSVLDTVPGCVGAARMQRCADQAYSLDFLRTMFGYPCLENRREFFAHFDCLSNVLNAHGRLQRCTRRADLEYARGDGGGGDQQATTLGVRQRRKCDSVNRYIDCVKPTLRLYCGALAAMVFHETLIKASPYVAPECQLSRTGRLDPRELDGPSTTANVLPVDFQLDGLEDLDDDRLTAQAADGDADGLDNSITNKGCSEPPSRVTCPNDKRPQLVVRWYRPPGATECMPFQYSYCNAAIDKRENVIRFEDECYDQCFTSSEALLKRFLATRKATKR